MPRVIHFEIHAADPARAQAFYEALFGWQFKGWAPPGQPVGYWLISTGEGPGIDGGMLPRHGAPPAEGQPVVFLADHGTTGGYPVIAVVDPADIARVAQARPGDALTFRWR